MDLHVFERVKQRIEWHTRKRTLCWYRHQMHSSGAPTAGGTVGEAPSSVGVLAWTPVVAVVLGVALLSGAASTRRFAGYSFSKARLALSVVRNPRFMAYSNVVCTIVNKSKETKRM